MVLRIRGEGLLEGLQVGGLPDGTVDTDMIATSAVTAAKIGSLPAGSILQTQFAIKTDTATTASTTPSVISGLTVNITPANASNLIILIASISSSYDSGDWGLGFYFGKDGSVISGATGDAASDRPRQTSVFIPGDGITGTNSMSAIPMLYREAAGGTSQITYSVMWRNSSATTGYLNRMVSDRDTSGYDPRCVSSLLAMEVAV